MVKKRIALSFLLLANIILLAHAVVSHHHHDGRLCLESSHCQECNAPDHQSEHEHNGAICHLLQEMVPARDHLSKASLDYPSNLGDHSGTFLLAIAPDFLRLYEPIGGQLFNASTTPYLFSFSSFAPACFGLRAPPFC